MDNEIKKIIEQGVDFLLQQQQANGGFIGLTSANLLNFRNAEKYHSTFPTSLIFSCLNNLKEMPTLKKIKRKAAGFLLAEKSEYWSFNYWMRNSQESKERPYPDDLDDTFCALSALSGYNPKLLDGEALAKITMLLTAVEEKEGGPYRTWLAGPDAPPVWKDVDLAVNSNVAYFLSLQDVSLKNLNHLVETAVAAQNYSSPYYPSPYPVIYFISRFYRGKKRSQIIDYLLLKKDAEEKWENPLNTGLAVSALLNFGVKPASLQKSILYLVESCQNSYAPYAFCLDPAKNGKKFYAGGATLTAAFCLEALGKYLNATEKPPISPPKKINKNKNAELAVYNEIKKSAQKKFSGLGGCLQQSCLQALSRMIKGDKDKQIFLLPYFCKSALGKNGAKISNELLVQLGLANLYGWMAYTIYDDFLDGDGNPELLGTANVCLRELTLIFNNVLKENSGFQNFWQEILNKIDEANGWETANCRLKIGTGRFAIPSPLPNDENYSHLAQKSIGHCLGPAAILFSLGYKADSSEVKNLLLFFRHYIIARQLDDDAHDWEDDLKKGRLNSVSIKIFEKWLKKNPAKKQISIRGNLRKLQELLWNEVIIFVCRDIKKHLSLAKKYLGEISLFENPSYFLNILLPIKKSADKALSEREEALKFLQTYKKI
ncbi:MAG: hypothetical protein V1661_01525 [bacterium]